MKNNYIKIDNKNYIIISERLYNGLVRSLSKKIEYQSRVEEAEREAKFLKYLTRNFKAFEMDSYNDDSIIIASKSYFYQGYFEKNFIECEILKKYLEEYENNPNYSGFDLYNDIRLKILEGD